MVAGQALNLNTIAQNFDMSRPAISQHIKILTECGLVVMRQQGRERYCELQLQPLTEIADWLEPFRKMWDDRFNRMDDLITQMKTNKTKKDGNKK